MHGGGGDAAHAERRGEQIRARPEMLDRAQILDAVALFLQRVVRRGNALDRDGLRLELERLGSVRREDERALGNERRADVLADDLVVIGYLLTLENDLHSLEGAAVVQLEKAEILHIADRARPAADGDVRSVKRGGVCPQLFDLRSFHSSFLPDHLPCIIGGRYNFCKCGVYGGAEPRRYRYFFKQSVGAGLCSALIFTTVSVYSRARRRARFSP